MHLSDAHHFRKMIAGACMVVAPVVLLVSMVIHPASDMNEATQVATIADNLDAWYVAHLLALISIALTVPVILGLMHMLREREVAFGHLGGGLAMLGLLAFAGVVGMELVMWQMVAGGSTREAVALLERLNETAGIVIPFVLVSFGLTLGLACLAFGLYRARAVQSWMAIFVAAGDPARGRVRSGAELAGDRGRGLPGRGPRRDRPDGPARDRRSLGAHPRIRGLPPRAGDALVPEAAAAPAAARVSSTGAPSGRPWL